ncbi:MAG: TlpA disulfide reductase family protein [Lachnospiraceae bacterium]
MKNKKLIMPFAIGTIMLTMAACGTQEVTPTISPTTIQNESVADQSEVNFDTPSFSNFSSIDLDGNEVTEEIFADYDLTMINIWGTFCGPCLREMPELGEIAEEYKEKGVQVIGIVLDVLDRNGEISDSQVETAKELVAQTQANYTHLLPSEDLLQAKLKYVTAVPETLFVDKEGNIIGSSLSGSRDKATWISIIEQKLEEINAKNESI